MLWLSDASFQEGLDPSSGNKLLWDPPQGREGEGVPPPGGGAAHEVHLQVVTQDGFYDVDLNDNYLLYDYDRGTSDYFLVENRRPNGRWEQSVPDRGLMIWRIAEGSWASAEVPEFLLYQLLWCGRVLGLLDGPEPSRGLGLLIAALSGEQPGVRSDEPDDFFASLHFSRW